MPIVTGRLSAYLTAPRPKPVIGYDNLFQSAGTFVDTGSNYELALNYGTYNGWLTGATGATFTFTATGAAEYADYFAFAAHDLHTYFGNIKLQYYDGSSWTTAAEMTPGTGDPFMLLFDKVASNKWRVVVSSTGAATIGTIFAGERLTLERGVHTGHEPAGFGRSSKIMDMTTEGGQFGGQAIQRTGSSGTIELQHVTTGWMRTHWYPFIIHAEAKPWFLMWSTDDYQTEVAYAKVASSIRARNTGPNFMTSTVAYQALTR